MKIAYVIIAHKYVEQLVRLIKRLDGDDIYFFIHISTSADDGYVDRLKREFSQQQNFFLVKREKVQWGGHGLVHAACRALEAVSNSMVDPDFTIILTGQCYPLKDNDTIKTLLAEYTGKQLVEHYTLPSPRWSGGGLARIERYHFWLFNRIIVLPPYVEPGTRKYYLAKLLDRLPYRKRQLPHGYQPFGGSLLITLSREGVRYLYQFLQTNVGRDLLKFITYSFAPDEFFFQTVLMNSPIRDTVVNEYLHYIDWSQRLAHPEILTSVNLPQLQTTNKLFARKFDLTIDAKVLDLLDEYARE